MVVEDAVPSETEDLMRENIKIEGEKSPHKAFRVECLSNIGEVIASFETLEEAIQHSKKQRLDMTWIVRHRNKIVWPEKYKS